MQQYPLVISRYGSIDLMHKRFTRSRYQSISAALFSSADSSESPTDLSRSIWGRGVCSLSSKTYEVINNLVALLDFPSSCAASEQCVISLLDACDLLLIRWAISPAVVLQVFSEVNKFFSEAKKRF